MSFFKSLVIETVQVVLIGTTILIQDILIERWVVPYLGRELPLFQKCPNREEPLSKCPDRLEPLLQGVQ